MAIETKASAPPSGEGRSRHFRIWLAGISTLFVVTILGILIHSVITFQSQKSDALVIDMAGRQRMLHQRHMMEVLLASSGSLSEYGYTRKILKETCLALIEGGPVILTLGQQGTVELPPAPTAAIRSKLTEQKEMARLFAERADAFLLVSPDASTYDMLLEELMQLNASLQRVSDQAVKLLDRHSEAKMFRMIIGDFAVLILVALIGLVLTRQAIRSNRDLEREISDRKRAEGETQRTQTLLTSIVENLPDMVFVKDAKDRRFVELNRAGEELLGYSRDQLIGKNDYDVFPSKEASYFWEKDAEVLEGRRLLDIPEEPIQTRSKGLRYLHTRKVPILGEGGHPDYLLGISEDITERKQAAAALRDSQAKLNRVTDAIPGAVYQYRLGRDGQQGFLYFSRGVEELLGLTAEQAQRDFDLVWNLAHPDDKEALWSSIQASAAALKPWVHDFRVVVEGQVKWLRGSSVPETPRPDGAIVWNGIMVDVTAQKKSQEAFTQLSRHNELILKSAGEGIYGVDSDGNATFINPAAASMIGYEVDELIGKSMHSVMHHTKPDGSPYPKEECVIYDAFKDGAVRHVDGDVFWRKDGSSFPVAYTSTPIRDDSGALIGAVVTFQDITERKRAEEALREMERMHQQILDAIADMVFVKEEGSRLVWANKAFREYYGMSEEELRGIIDAPFNEPSYTEQYLKDDAYVFETGETLDIPQEPVTRHDGEVRLFHTVKSPIVDGTGRVIRTVGVARDTTERRRAEEAVRYSESKLRAIIENSTDAIMLKDLEGRYLLINAAGAQLLDRAVDQVLGKRDDELFDQESAGRIMVFDQEVMRTGVPQSTEESLTIKGRKLWFYTSKVPYWSEEGRVIGIIGVAHDITERKRAEHALRDSEERYRVLYEDNPCMYFTVRSDGTVLSVNAFGAEQLGYTVRELVGQPVADVFHEEDQPAVSRLLTECLEDPSRINHWELRKVRKDGTVLWVKETARAVLDVSEAPAVLIVCEDISVRKRAERALQESERRYALATAEARIGVWDWNLETGEFYLDPNIKAILGYHDHEIPNDLTEWAKHVYPDDRLGAFQAARDHMEGRTPQYIYEHRMIHKDGSVKWIMVRGVCHRDHTGKAVRMIGTDMDITERKRAEEVLRTSEEKTIAALRQSDALKSALLSSVSHELRTPLTAIKTMVSGLMGSEQNISTEIKEEFLGGIHEEIDYLNSLVDNLLDMSKIEAGSLAPRREWHLLEDLVEGAIRRRDKALHGRPLVVKLPDDLQWVCVDGVEIQRVLVNLLDNAVKYSPSNSPIRIEAGLRGKEVEVRITNSGPGIPREDLERVFDRFYRVRSDAGRMKPGTGLGLAICKGIVEAHGCRIWAESVQDGETTIAFTLPSPDPAPAGQPGTAEASQ